MKDPAASYQRRAQEAEELIVTLRSRLLQLRAEVEQWPDAKHGLRAVETPGTPADPDELAGVVAAQIREARAALAHVGAALQYGRAAANRLYVQ